MVGAALSAVTASASEVHEHGQTFVRSIGENEKESNSGREGWERETDEARRGESNEGGRESNAVAMHGAMK